MQRPGGSFDVQIGMLPGDKLFYFDVAADQYLSMEELTRKILDNVNTAVWYACFTRNGGEPTQADF